MQTPYSAKPVTLSIAAVERDTGLSKDTLRVWERRYGFPTPQRDALGERSYPFGQVERLRTIKRLLDAGHRPGRIVAMASADLERLAAVVGLPAMPREVAASVEPATDLSLFVEAVSRNDVDGLRRMLARSLSRLGLGHFVLDVVAPLNVQVGEAWMHGQLEVYQEHVYTESVQVVLRNALHHLPPAGVARPRVLLATVHRRAARSGPADGRSGAGARRLSLRVARRADAGLGHRARSHSIRRRHRCARLHRLHQPQHHHRRPGRIARQAAAGHRPVGRRQRAGAAAPCDRRCAT